MQSRGCFEVGIRHPRDSGERRVRMVSFHIRSCWLGDLDCSCYPHRMLVGVVEVVHIPLGLVVGILHIAVLVLDRIVLVLDLGRTGFGPDPQLEPVLEDYNRIR